MTDEAPFRFRSPAPGLFSGLGAAFAGLALSVRRGPVRKHYVRLVLVVSLVCLALQAAGIWAVVTFGAADADASTLSVIGHVLAEIVGVVLVLLAAPLLALILVSTAVPVLAESLFFAALATRRPALAATLRQRDGLPLVEGLKISARLMVTMLVVSAVSFALSFIPVAGAVLGPAFQLIGTARVLTWELLDPWFDRNRMHFGEQKAFVGAHRGLALGFGVPNALLLAVPLVGPLAFGIAQAGAALLISNALLEPERPLAGAGD